MHVFVVGDGLRTSRLCKRGVEDAAPYRMNRVSRYISVIFLLIHRRSQNRYPGKTARSPAPVVYPQKARLAIIRYRGGSSFVSGRNAPICQT